MFDLLFVQNENFIEKPCRKKKKLHAYVYSRFKSCWLDSDFEKCKVSYE